MPPKTSPLHPSARRTDARGHDSLNTSSPEWAREIRDDWTRTTLGQLNGERGQSVEPAKTPEEQFELYSVPSFPHRMPEIVAGKEVGSNKQLVEPSSVLLCKINPRINRAWVVGNFTPHTKIASTEWIIFPPNEEVTPDFLCYFLQQNAVRDFLAHNASGVGGSLMRVKPSTIRDFPFAYPQTKEQRRIVAEIEKQFTRLEAGVAALRRVQANLKRYRAAVLKAACEGKLVPTEAELVGRVPPRDGRRNPENAAWGHAAYNNNASFETGEQLLKRILAERRKHWQESNPHSAPRTRHYKEPSAPDTANLPLLPKGWTWATIAQIAAAIVDCPHSTPKWTNEGRICVRTTEFRPGLLDLTEVRFVSEQSYHERIARLEPRPGDIL